MERQQDYVLRTVEERGIRFIQLWFTDVLGTAKSFNINFAALYGRLGEARATPSNLWCGDEEARAVVEQLTRDAGYEPVYTGPLGNAAAQESLIRIVFAIAQGGMGPFVYRMAPPDQL